MRTPRSGGARPGGAPASEPLRGLAAPGPSKVGIEAAMRARDVSRADVAARDGCQAQSVGAAGSSGSSPVDS